MTQQPLIIDETSRKLLAVPGQLFRITIWSERRDFASVMDSNGNIVTTGTREFCTDVAEKRNRAAGMIIQHLKTWPEYYEEIISGRKTFEVRRNDRNFAVGDILILQEYEPETQYNEARYTGRESAYKVDYILTGGNFGVKRGYVVMAISPHEAASE